MTEMPFAKNHDVIEAFASERADQALACTVLPRRSRRGWLVANAHRANAPCKGVAVDTVAVTDEVIGQLLPPAGFGELSGDPVRGGMRGYAYPQHCPSVVSHN